MAVFDRFRRKQKSVLPDEVNQYYQSQQRERTGVAILLGIVALIVTLLIGAALFFGGRYIYRQIRGDNNKTQQTTDQNGNGTFEGTQNEQNGQSNSSNTQQNNSSGQTSSSNSQSTQTQGSNTPAQTPQTTPALGDQTTTLPRTGDEGM